MKSKNVYSSIILLLKEISNPAELRIISEYAANLAIAMDREQAMTTGAAELKEEQND